MSKRDVSDEQASPYSMADLGASLAPGYTGLSAADRAGLVSSLKDKLQNLAGKSSGYVESLSLEVKKRVNALQELQKQHDELETRFREEKAALEAKYQKLYEPLYLKRSDIVNGVVDVDVLKDGTLESDLPGSKKQAEEKGIPEFWLTAMKTNDILTSQITERDEGALKYIRDIKAVTLENPKGFRLDFYFESNPYFKNLVLSKTYHLADEDEPVLDRAIGTEIEWSPGKNLTQKILKKKPKKGAKNAKPVTKTEQCESFFNFFSPPETPEDEEDVDTDVFEQLQEQLEQDYDIGSTIREKIVPHAVSWFTGEALQGEDFDDDDDEEDVDGDDEDEDEDDEDEEDEEEEDEDEEEKFQRRKPVQKNSTSQGGEQPSDCKQQ